MAELNRVFEFKECVNIVKATGKKATTLRELRDLISVVSDDVIFHHTYQYFLKDHIQEYTNDFARAAMNKWMELGDTFWGMFARGF